MCNDRPELLRSRWMRFSCLRLGLLELGSGGESVLVRLLTGRSRRSSKVLALKATAGELLRRLQSSVKDEAAKSFSLLLGEATVAEGIATRQVGIRDGEQQRRRLGTRAVQNKRKRFLGPRGRGEASKGRRLAHSFICGTP